MLSCTTASQCKFRAVVFSTYFLVQSLTVLPEIPTRDLLPRLFLLNIRSVYPIPTIISLIRNSTQRLDTSYDVVKNSCILFSFFCSWERSFLFCLSFLSLFFFWVRVIFLRVFGDHLLISHTAYPALILAFVYINDL